MLRNGIFYKNDEIKDTYEIIDENIVRHFEMTRIQSKSKTDFQKLLGKIANEVIPDDLASQLFCKFPLIRPNQSLFFSNDDKVIIDAYNDTYRRVFESIFAKKILSFYLNSLQFDKLEQLINELLLFLKREHGIFNKKFLDSWENEKKGISTEKDDSLNFYGSLRPDLINLINENHFSIKNSELLLKLYDLHYLTHAVSKLESYKTRHPGGIIELYDNSFKKRHVFYYPSHRGRISGFGFNKDNPSYHLGTLRSMDPAPYDLRKSILTSNTTRCPDRLYMIHPKMARLDLDNWLHQSFSNELNSGYVNGLSGSILLEIRVMLFFILSINNQYYQCHFLKKEELFKNNFSLIQDYFLLITSLFVYFEGGHTISEILSVFEIEDVSKTIKTILSPDEDKKIFTQQKFLIETVEIKNLMKQSLIETKRLYSIQMAKSEMHNELKKTVPIQYT